jgi:putative ABC transport system ATP-binding protein
MTNIIDIEHLKIGTDSLNIIEDFSLSLKKGEFVGIKGPSGSGKSTILKYMAQILNPNLKVSGDYQYQDQDIYDYEPTDIRKEITYCFQSPSLFGQTVQDNLQFPFDIRGEEFEEERAKQYLKELDLAPDYLSKEIDTLSGGEKQRVALIRNLMIQPKVILLDEISSALDRNTREIVWDWLEDYTKDTDISMVLVTHLDEEYEQTDRVIEIEKTEDLSKKEQEEEQTNDAPEESEEDE